MSHPETTEQKATVTLTLDGRTVEVASGDTIIQAAAKNGIKIPTLCYLKKMRPIGSCRVCSVEVEGIASPVMSCVTPVSDGMVVTTDSPKIREFRKNMIQFILVNHPLDCPVCERSGECQLQNLTYEFGIHKHDWATLPPKRVPMVDWDLIQYNRNLCIICERCVVICREVQGLAALKIDGTGNSGRINTITGEKLDCDFCGQCISVCPVGALSSGMYFSSRSWEVEKTQAVCPHCGVGCSFNVNVKNGKVVRVTSSDAIGNNKGNLCARGRFGYEFVQSPDRLTAPLIRRGHGFETTDWDTALGYIADRLKEYVGVRDAVAGIGSERATNEDNYVFQKFFRQVLKSGNLDNMSSMANPEMGVSRFDAFGDIPMTCSFDELKEGNLFVFIGLDGSNENPVVSNHIREAIYGHGAEVALLYSKRAEFLPAPRAKLVYDYTLLHQTVMALLGGVAKNIAGEGGFPGGVQIPQEIGRKIETSANSAVGQLDAELQSQLAGLVSLIRKRQKPVFLVGQEAQHHPQSAAIVQNIANLARITGGRVMVMREYCNTQGVSDMGVVPNMLPGYVKETNPDLQVTRNMCDLLHTHVAKAFFVVDEDPLRRHPDFLKFRSALDKADFTVVIDKFYTQTAMASDVILPSCTAMEKAGTFTNIEGRVQRFSATVSPVGLSRPVWQIMSDLAKKMGVDFGYAGSNDVTADIAQNVPMYRDIKKGASLAHYGEMLKATPQLRWVEPKAMGKLGKDGGMVVLPEHSLFVMGVYTDHCPSLRHLVGKHYADFHMEGKPYVDMNPGDASRLGLVAEDTLVFKNPKKEWKGRVRINPDVRLGSLRIPDEMDQFPVMTMVAGGKEVECVNQVGLEG